MEVWVALLVLNGVSLVLLVVAEVMAVLDFFGGVRSHVPENIFRLVFGMTKGGVSFGADCDMSDPAILLNKSLYN